MKIDWKRRKKRKYFKCFSLYWFISLSFFSLSLEVEQQKNEFFKTTLLISIDLFSNFIEISCTDFSFAIRFEIVTKYRWSFFMNSRTENNQFNDQKQVSCSFLTSVEFYFDLMIFDGWNSENQSLIVEDFVERFSLPCFAHLSTIFEMRQTEEIRWKNKKERTSSLILFGIILNKWNAVNDSCYHRKRINIQIRLMTTFNNTKLRSSFNIIQTCQAIRCQIILFSLLEILERRKTSK